jgi:hypothetical protein
MKRHGEGLERQTFLPGLAKMLESADFMHRKVNVGKDKLTVYTDLLNETSSELRRYSSDSSFPARLILLTHARSLMLGKDLQLTQGPLGQGGHVPMSRGRFPHNTPPF